jgi:hypothetical protein
VASIGGQSTVSPLEPSPIGWGILPKMTAAGLDLDPATFNREANGPVWGTIFFQNRPAVRRQFRFTTMKPRKMRVWRKGSMCLEPRVVQMQDRGSGRKTRVAKSSLPSTTALHQCSRRERPSSERRYLHTVGLKNGPVFPFNSGHW